ncbi:trihelix transcription factor ENAP2-like isoform X2 [Andrographis paniculata]|uniref:trihelix transcription factor ENAP2-like isoform X2 n=1 Tax=Andrographis paniculata TaxID=175694 RepID=UPI0021E8F160|nr:trihelix transcription factor ENAP2-like isoform X2 [Andrographis paniculata]
MSSQSSPSLPSSPSSPRPPSDDDKQVPQSPASPAKPSEPAPTPAARNPAFPSREDCWSEEATRTLIDAWGTHYLQLNRGNLRQKHWQEVADAVNAVHAASAKHRRTDVQCKNRIDTTKKKYKIEKSKVIESNGRYDSTWPHFESLDSLIGDSFSKPNNNAAAADGHTKNLRRRVSISPELSSSPSPLPESVAHRRKNYPATNPRDKDPASNPLPRLTWSVPVGPRSKRSGPGSVTERNFSVMAAAAAAMEAEEDDCGNYDDDDDEDEDSGAWSGRRPSQTERKRKLPAIEEQAKLADGYRQLAEAILRLGQIYEKVEDAKQRQMVELEKQRMQFAKDLELERMKVFMESQVRLEKLKRAKPNSADI